MMYEINDEIIFCCERVNEKVIKIRTKAEEFLAYLVEDLGRNSSDFHHCKEQVSFYNISNDDFFNRIWNEYWSNKLSERLSEISTTIETNERNNQESRLSRKTLKSRRTIEYRAEKATVTKIK